MYSKCWSKYAEEQCATERSTVVGHKKGSGLIIVQARMCVGMLGGWCAVWGGVVQHVFIAPLKGSIRSCFMKQNNCFYILAPSFNNQLFQVNSIACFY